MRSALVRAARSVVHYSVPFTHGVLKKWNAQHVGVSIGRLDGSSADGELRVASA